MDITKHDHLLRAIRTELGSTQSKNLVLRQEVAALKKALLAGRGVDMILNTPAALSLDALNPFPPVPFPEPRAAEELVLRATAVSSASAPTAGIQQHAPHTQHAKRSIYVSAAFCSWRAEAFRRLGLVRFEWE
ncbi:hypothetical protein GYMLUDRAFT_246105 [Collybiopsis luxurians FD-317 M1]|uniref:Uncharacterized protein n=1 Tax=Collybiopsis luxurians FD-317 M1 TaxID=944289 RepID=A0A0D0B4Y0_9AGAR|nr:hypothetical protein GYMLUDRAFT_246105 [Collybiopsis luxurians FD-317 M1]